MFRLPVLARCTLAGLAALAAPLAAQELVGPPSPLADATSAEDQAMDAEAAPDQAMTSPASSDKDVDFTSDTLDYDDQQNIVTVTGNVRMARGGSRLRADRVVWNRATGQVHAEGNVAITDPQGDTAYSDNADLTDDLKDGVADNLLLVLEDGGRLAAAHGVMQDSVATLDRGAYSPCRVNDDSGCPKKPEWEITAVRVVHNPKTHRVSYRDAQFTLFGKTLMWLPAFSHPDGQGSGGNWGLLIPQATYNHTNGLELGLPYYLQLAPNRDLTITPRVYTAVDPSLEVDYRDLTRGGAFQIDGMITYGTRLPATFTPIPDSEGQRGIRGFLNANGKWQLSPTWSVTASIRLVTDPTFLRRYDISSDDILRSLVEVERIDTDSYLSIAGYGVETLRVGDSEGQQPIALPAIDYRLRFKDPWIGGQFEAEVNSLNIIRTEGQDTQRAFARLEWDLKRYTPLGQVVTLTAYGRGDVYHTDDVEATEVAIYRGDPGWSARAIGALAADMQWPFVGSFMGGTQVITPRVQIVASPATKNLSIPNEDSRAIDLEDSNLFALNRFPGYDRWEDGTRVTYGGEWHYDRPKLSIDTLIGQSYRFVKASPDLFPDGTGLEGRFSDFVGRTTLKYGRLLELTHRFRLDKDTLALRRNEIDATLGGSKTYFEVGYLLLNRNIDTAIEDLRDVEEVRLGARVQITRKVSLFGSTTIDLTTRAQDPLSLSDGFSPVRDRVGLLYADECLELGLTWRRDYQTIGDARPGNTVALRFALKNLGR